MAVSRNNHQAVAVILLLAALALAYACYQPGLGAALHFDDRPSLAGMEKVEDGRSAIEFTLSGNTGPLGRPLALASFLINQSAWPDDPAPFLYTNLLLHLINGLLVAWLALRIGMAREEPTHRAGYTASLTAAIWMLLPILAATSLLVVQRMTSLSASFVLMGLIAYLFARRNLEKRPGRALFGMSASLTVFTLLAAFTKENGALLPVFALVAEATLLPLPNALLLRGWRAWSGVFLWAPLAAVLVILATQLPYSELTREMREFTAWERLLTQAVVLWEYLFHAFLPLDTAQLGPFQTGHRVYRSLADPVALAAASGWLATMGLALAFRRQVPVITFAVLWYLGGHLLESTAVPLELYFEHRNYLPLAGPMFAVAWYAVRAPGRLRVFAGASMAAYFALLAVTLMLVTSLWGKPFQAAQAQYRDDPQSPRTVAYLFAHLYALGALEPAERLLDRAIAQGVNRERYKVSKLYLACRHGTLTFEPPARQPLERGLASGDFDRHLPHALYVVAATRAETGCPPVRPDAVRDLLDALVVNPVYRNHGESRYWLRRARGELAEAAGERTAAARHYRRALDWSADPALAERVVGGYLRDGDLAGACRVVSAIREGAGLNPARWLHRRMAAERLLEWIREAERPAEGSPCGDA